jgi:tetratricopeptide (TPR) repeat protein
MKKIILFLIINLIIVNLSFSQSVISIIGKSGGQLLQDLSKKNEWRSIGKAIESAGDMVYEMEKINASNKQEITIKTNPDNIERVYPAKGYRWKNPKISNDFEVVQVKGEDIERSNNAIELFEKSYGYFEKGDWDKSLEYINKSIELESEVVSYLFRGYLYSANGLYDKALEDFGIVFNYDVSEEAFIEFHINKGTVLNMKGDYNKAIDNFKNAITLIGENSFDSRLYTLYNELANTKRNLGNYNEAINDINRAILLNSDYYQAYSTRGGIKVLLGEYKDALIDYNISLDKLGKDEEVPRFFILGMKSSALFENGNYTKTISCANEVINMYNNGMSSEVMRKMYYLTIYTRGKAKIELGIAKSGCADILNASNFDSSIVDWEYYNKNCK